MVRALAAMILAILLHGHVARAQEAGGEPAPLGPSVINSLVARVALYPDPLLALVLQGSTPASWARATCPWSRMARIMAARARTMFGCLIAYPSRESLSAWDGMNRAF